MYKYTLSIYRLSHIIYARFARTRIWIKKVSQGEITTAKIW